MDAATAWWSEAPSTPQVQTYLAHPRTSFLSYLAVLGFKVAYCSVFTDKETGEPKGSAKLEPGALDGCELAEFHSLNSINKWVQVSATCRNHAVQLFRNVPIEWI